MMSPVIVDGLCIVELGSETDGGIVAYDVSSGEQKWKWTGDGPAYIVELAAYKVADKEAYGCPILSGNRLFVKDQDSLTLWSIE
jgi:hypothetical protein